MEYSLKEKVGKGLSAGVGVVGVMGETDELRYGGLVDGVAYVEVVRVEFVELCMVGFTELG